MWGGWAGRSTVEEREGEGVRAELSFRTYVVKLSRTAPPEKVSQHRQQTLCELWGELISNVRDKSSRVGSVLSAPPD